MKQYLIALSKADYVTLLGISMAVVSLYILTAGSQAIAIGLLIFSVLFDFMDGIIARKYGGSDLGAALDSSYDILAFVAFPIILISGTSLNVPRVVIALALSAFTIAAVLRLAKFNLQTTKQKSRGYVGLPVLYSLVAIVAINQADGMISLAWIALMTPLMLSSIKFAKPKGVPVIVLLLTASCYFLFYV